MFLFCFFFSRIVEECWGFLMLCPGAKWPDCGLQKLPGRAGRCQVGSPHKNHKKAGDFWFIPKVYPQNKPQELGMVWCCGSPKNTFHLVGDFWAIGLLCCGFACQGAQKSWLLCEKKRPRAEKDGACHRLYGWARPKTSGWGLPGYASEWGDTFNLRVHHEFPDSNGIVVSKHLETTPYCCAKWFDGAHCEPLCESLSTN